MIIELLASFKSLGILALTLSTIGLWLRARVLAEAISEKIHAAILALVTVLSARRG